MPYSSNSDLPEAVRSRYSSHCQDVWRNVWNSVYNRTGDESRAFASANSKANQCEGKKAMKTATATPMFKIFAPLLKATTGPDGKKRFHGVASSSIQDRHGDVMTNSALDDMERSANDNMTIFLNHEYRVPEDVAGSVERAILKGHPTDPEIRDLVFDIVVNEANPRAVNAWEAIESGTKLGLSIGAMIPDGGATRDRKSGQYVIDHVELLETSLVGVPANPRSWVEYAVKSLSANREIVLETEDTIVMEIENTDAPEETIEEVIEKESHPELPDSAFACIDSKGRHYPHHTSGGAVNKSLLRNALSRCGDASNTHCGCAHIRAHARKLGIGQEKGFEWLNESTGVLDLDLALTTEFDEDHFEAELDAEDLEHKDDPPEIGEVGDQTEETEDSTDGAEAEVSATTSQTASSSDNVAWTVTPAPDKTDATVSVETPFANITVDTGNRGQKPANDGSSQEALASAPESEDEDKTPSPFDGILPVKSGEPLLDEDVQAALGILEPTVVTSLTTSTELLRAVTRELIVTQEALETRNEEYAALEVEVRKVLTGTAKILDQVSNTPLGRRAVIREAIDEFESLKGPYSETFVELLKKRS